MGTKVYNILGKRVSFYSRVSLSALPPTHHESNLFITLLPLCTDPQNPPGMTEMCLITSPRKMNDAGQS